MIDSNLKKNITQIKNIYISNCDYWHITPQSCDCQRIIVDTGEKFILFKHQMLEDTGCIIFDQVETWKKKTLTNYYVRPLQEQIFENGNLIYNNPNLKEIASFAKNELDNLWDEVRRIENPHKYYVDISKNLWDLKNEMLNIDKE